MTKTSYIGRAKVVWESAKVLTKVRNLTDDEVEAAAKRVARRARALCPVGDWERSSGEVSWQKRKPGTLRKTIKARPSKFKDGGWIVTVGSRDAFYARFVELGTPGTVRRTRSWEKYSVNTRAGWRSGNRRVRAPRTPIPANPFMRRGLKMEARRFVRNLNKKLT